MSGTKKIISAQDVAKSLPAKANSEPSQSSRKRGAEEMAKPKAWAPLNRQVFVTKGVGTFKEILVANTGVQKNLFWILGTCADGKVLVLQVWGPHAKKFFDLFTALAEPNFAPTLWVIPPPKAKGLYFREGKPNDYQQKNHGVSFSLNLDFSKQDSAPFPSLTVDAFPSKFDWSDGPFEDGGCIIPHYRHWGAAIEDTEVEAVDDLANYVPPMRKYYDASPLKERRTESSSSKKVAATDLDFADE